MARTLRVLFDDALALNPAGTGTFTRGIQTPLSRLDGIELIPAGSAARPHQLDIVNKGILRRMRNGADRVWYYLDTLPRLAARNRCDVIYCPAALTALRGRVPAVMTVFDMTTRLFPHTLDPLSGIYARQMLRIGLRRSSTICTISQAVRAELLSRYPRLTPDRVHVAYPGPSPELMQADPQPALPDDAPFLLMVGTLEPRKNHVTALRAFARYRQGPHDARLRLVLAGSPGWRYQPVVDEIERLGLQDAVVRLGPTTPGRLKWLYQHARALLFPSLYEGFGLPVLEAFALPCPYPTFNAAAPGWFSLSPRHRGRGAARAPAARGDFHPAHDRCRHRGHQQSLRLAPAPDRGRSRPAGGLPRRRPCRPRAAPLVAAHATADDGAGADLSPAVQSGARPDGTPAGKRAGRRGRRRRPDSQHLYGTGGVLARAVPGGAAVGRAVCLHPAAAPAAARLELAGLPRAVPLRRPAGGAYPSRSRLADQPGRRPRPGPRHSGRAAQRPGGFAGSRPSAAGRSADRALSRTAP